MDDVTENRGASGEAGVFLNYFKALSDRRVRGAKA